MFQDEQHVNNLCVDAVCTVRICEERHRRKISTRRFCPPLKLSGIYWNSEQIRDKNQIQTVGPNHWRNYKTVFDGSAVQGLQRLRDRRSLWNVQASAGELPVVVPSFVDVSEDLGLLDVLGLVSKPSAAPALLHLYTFTAVDVWRGRVG